jgi:hypothetical protein
VLLGRFAALGSATVFIGVLALLASAGAAVAVSKRDQPDLEILSLVRCRFGPGVFDV